MGFVELFGGVYNVFALQVTASPVPSPVQVPITNQGAVQQFGQANCAN